MKWIIGLAGLCIVFILIMAIEQTTPPLLVDPGVKIRNACSQEFNGDTSFEYRDCVIRLESEYLLNHKDDQIDAARRASQ